MLGGVGGAGVAVGCCVLVQGSAVGQDRLAQSPQCSTRCPAWHCPVWSGVVLTDAVPLQHLIQCGNTQLGAAGCCPEWCPVWFCASLSVWFGVIIALPDVVPGLVPRPALPAAVPGSLPGSCLVWCLVQYPVQQFPVSAHCSMAQIFAWFGTQFRAHCSSAWHSAQFCAWFHAHLFAQSSAQSGPWFSAGS